MVARQLCAKKIGFSPLTFDDSETHHKDQDGLSCFKSAWSPPANDRDNTEAHQLSIGDFKLKKMTATRLRSLTVQLGAHYVFFHQGNCEHTFAFVDIREKNEHDSQLPALIFRRKIRRRLCSVCCGSTTKHGSRGKAYAKFVTFDDRLAGDLEKIVLTSYFEWQVHVFIVLLFFAGQSPCFFCTQCYWDLHYSSSKSHAMPLHIARVLSLRKWNACTHRGTSTLWVQSVSLLEWHVTNSEPAFFASDVTKNNQLCSVVTQNLGWMQCKPPHQAPRHHPD